MNVKQAIVNAAIWLSGKEMVRGVDTSFWQTERRTNPWGRIDWRQMAAKGVRFAFIRAGQGKYPDPCFEYDFKAAGDNGILRGAYWFYEYRAGLDPGARDQAKRFLDATKGDGGELGYVMDFERPNGEWPVLPPRSRCHDIMDDFYAVLDGARVKADLFYSNPAGLLHIAPPERITNRRKLWVAHYGVVRPTVYSWKEWTFWQYTDRLDAGQYGVPTTAAKQLDGNYFNGTYADLLAFCKLEQAPTQPESPTEPQPPQGEDDMIRVIYRGRVNRQNIRALPNTSSKVIGTLNAGQELQELIDIACYSPTNIWLKFRDTPAGEGWVALYYGGTTYLTQIV